MEWFILRGRLTDTWPRYFIVLLVGILVSMFASILVSSTPVLAQNPIQTPDQTEVQNPDEIGTQENQTQPDGSYTSSCNVQGVGWIICGPAVWIADGMDLMFTALTDFLKVRPMELGSQDSTFYQAWDVMRGIANAAFIIAFLIIIYSHVSSFGISNYGLKKLAPRLIVAAVLVNVSFIICAAAIDLSNILGFALNDLFNHLTKELLANGSANFDGMVSFASITQAFLSGGALAVAGFTAVGGSLTAATPLLIPLLAILFLSLLIALLVMSARQALIVILVVISPLAFVCYLLPGTEKWFEKWRTTLLTLLIFFPAFAVVFGGSQMAGMIIMTNAESVVIFLLGLTVMLAPLAITPLILKLGGGLLNRFAGMVNDPTKGVIDKSKQWAQNKSKAMSMNSYEKMAKKRKDWSDNGKNGNPLKRAWYASGAYGAARRSARYFDNQGRLVKDQAEEAEKTAQNIYHDSSSYKRHDLKSRGNADRAELLSQEASNRYDEMKGGKAPADIAPGWVERNIPGGDIITRRKQRQVEVLTEETQVLYENIAIQGFRKTNNQRQLNQMFADKMVADRDVQKAAAGIYGEVNAAGEYAQGMDAALAQAISTMRSDYGKSVEEGAQIVKHFNLSSEQRQKHALGEAVTAYDSKGHSRVFDQLNTFTREAAIEEQIAVGTVAQVREIVELSGSELSGYKTTISAAVAKSGVKGKAPYIGGKLIDDIAKGSITSKESLIGYIQDWIADGKFRDEDIAITDPDGLKLLMEAARSDTSHMNPDLQSKMADGLVNLATKAQRSLEIDDLSQHVSQKAHPLMEKISRRDFSK